jgi:hypothetical protein
LAYPAQHTLRTAAAIKDVLDLMHQPGPRARLVHESVKRGGQASRCLVPRESSERRGTGGVSRTASLQRSLPGLAPRTFREALAHPDDLRCVPSAASRRRDLSRIERCCDRICRQRGQLIQDWPKPFCAIIFCRQVSMSAKHARPADLASIEAKRSPRFGGGVRTNTEVEGVVHLKPLFPRAGPDLEPIHPL